VPLAEGALLEADGLVLVLPLAEVPVPGALSLIAPPDVPLVLDVEEVVLELGELLGEVVVVVVVVVFSVPLVPMLDVLLVPAALFDQSPCTFTECPTCAERSCGLSSFANFPFFSCSM
jgi:hypothetical protein